MVLAMARPARRSRSSFFQFRKRIPPDIIYKARGQHLKFAFPSEDGGEEVIASAAIGASHLTFSLLTRDPAVAKLRMGMATAQFERFCEGVRKGPQSLSHKQIVALAGVLYREWIAACEDNPGDPEGWGIIASNNIDAMDSFPALERRFGQEVDNLLTREGIVPDRESRRNLLRETALATTNAADRLRRYAEGDYRPDPKAGRFPAWESAPVKSDRKGKGEGNGKSNSATDLTLDDLFERWMREAAPSPSTVTTWRSYMRQLKTFVGHDDPARVTKADIVAWKDSLLAADRVPKGIRDGQLAATRSIFNYGLANDLLTVNPALGVTIRQKKKAGTKMLSYSDAEVARILALATAQTKPDRRWLPWLMALSGARVGELAQLWGRRIVEFDGVWVMKIAPAEDGGTLKNEGSERDVPIHPTILERGFLDFVQSRGDGPLFYRGGKVPKDIGSRDPGARHASKGVANHLAAWIRANGFSEQRKAPNHALRHWFKTACQSAGVQDSVADAIQGHSGSRGEADTYRHASIKTMAAAIARVEVPRLQTEASQKRKDDTHEQTSGPNLA
jgi:integrase